MPSSNRRSTTSPHFAALVALAVAGCTQPAPGPSPSDGARARSVIDTVAIRAYTLYLSADRLRGRETDSPGADLAASYIAEQCRALGLAPIAGSYDLPVPLARSDASGSELVERFADHEQAFHGVSDFVPRGGTSRALVDFGGAAVLVGTSQDILTGPAPTLNGSVAVTLGVIDGPAVDTLVARGAVGVVQLTGDEESFRAGAEDLMYVADTTTRSSYFPNWPTVVAGPAASRALLSGRTRDFRPGPLGATVQVRLQLRPRPVPARNVGCLLRGSDAARADSAIAITAHYDHLGVGAPDARGDSIYNGFSDNAAGVAMVLAIGQAMTGRRERPLHSVLFLFFTGEERGLLGSDYYVAHPPWPLSRTIGVINLDAGAPPGLVWSWRIAGGLGSPLGRLAVDVALSRGWSAIAIPPRANTDYYPFIRMGVPAIFPVPAPGPYQGLSADSSQALRRRWDHYHQPADEWHDDFPFAGLGRYAEFAMLTAQALDRSLSGRR